MVQWCVTLTELLFARKVLDAHAAWHALRILVEEAFEFSFLVATLLRTWAQIVWRLDILTVRQHHVALSLILNGHINLRLNVHILILNANLPCLLLKV